MQKTILGSFASRFLDRQMVVVSTLLGCWCAWAGGLVTNLTQADLESAMAGGGAVLFGTNGTVVLSRTITVTKDASLDANGYSVTVSGAGAVRLFQVNTNVQLAVNGVSLADAQFIYTT